MAIKALFVSLMTSIVAVGCVAFPDDSYNYGHGQTIYRGDDRRYDDRYDPRYDPRYDGRRYDDRYDHGNGRYDDRYNREAQRQRIERERAYRMQQLDRSNKQREQAKRDQEKKQQWESHKKKWEEQNKDRKELTNRPSQSRIWGARPTTPQQWQKRNDTQRPAQNNPIRKDRKDKKANEQDK